MSRAPAALHAARRAVGQALVPGGLTLVACSGGADSLALAAAAAWHHRRSAENNDDAQAHANAQAGSQAQPRAETQSHAETQPHSSGDSQQTRVGAVVINHHLQTGSDEVSARAAEQLRSLGLEPVITLSAQIDPHSDQGPEAAARAGRYRAFATAMAETGAQRILLGHTKDDQAEQVLLGLARGSGTRSLAGIPPVRGPFHRPLLGLTRAETEAICAHEELQPWQDPDNADPRFLRSKIREQVLPYLEQHLDAGIREALVRTAEIAAADAQYLEEQAKTAFTQLLEDPDPQGRLRLKLKGLQDWPPAIRRRVIALAVVACGAPAPTAERIAAVEKLVTGSKSAGPVQLEGHLQVYRGARSSEEYGKLVFVPTPI